MADGASSTVVNAFLASLLNGTAFTNYGTLYCQLHVGAPGSAGTSNVAGESTRKRRARSRALWWIVHQQRRSDVDKRDNR